MEDHQDDSVIGDDPIKACGSITGSAYPRFA